MDVNKYVSFSKFDIIEALQDLYEKKTGNKIDIIFNEENNRAITIRSLSVKISLEGKAEIFRPDLGIEYDDRVEYGGDNFDDSIKSGV